MNSPKLFSLLRATLAAAALFATLPILLQGCAHSAIDQSIDDKMARQSSVKNRADLNNEAGGLIQNAPGLVEAQRKQLSDLRTKTSAAMADLSDQSLRLRGVLIQEVVALDCDLEEVQAIKDRLKRIEDKRLSIMFDAVDQANSILGHGAPLPREQIINSMMIEDRRFGH